MKLRILNTPAHVSPDDIDLYALDKLRSPDIEAFEEHVSGCRACYNSLVEAIAFAARYSWLSVAR